MEGASQSPSKCKFNHVDFFDLSLQSFASRATNQQILALTIAADIILKGSRVEQASG
jgi:hypothetical protein